MRSAAIVLGLLAALSVGCKRAPENATPEGAATELLAALEAMATDPARSKDALALLGPVTSKNLEGRAQRASKVEGRTLSAAQYLAGVRYLPKTRVAKLTVTPGGGASGPLPAQAEVAEITATDDQGRDLVHLTAVKQGELWRIELPLPDMQPLQKRANQRPN